MEKETAGSLLSLEECEKKQKLTPEYIYFEPKFCSDVSIDCNNTSFHLHKSILAKDSVYFKSLFEEDKTSNQIQLPRFQDIFNHQITSQHFHWFFRFLYDREEVSCTDREDVYAIVHLAHYFQVEWMERWFHSNFLNFVKANPLHSNNFAELHVAITYHWDKVRDEMLALIAVKVCGIRKSAEYNDKYWKMLDWTCKERILEEVLQRMTPTKCEHWVIKLPERPLECRCGFTSDKVSSIVEHIDKSFA